MAARNPFEPDRDYDNLFMTNAAEEAGGAPQDLPVDERPVDPPSLPRTGFAPTTGPRAPQIGGQGGTGRGSFTFQPPNAGAFQYGWNFGRHAGNQYSYDNPAEGAKYAFANYIGEAGLDPNSANSGSIAQELNRRYGSNVFQAEGDRRVRYGDEFVDWSGEGKPAGQFFWGSANAAPGGGGGGGVPAPGGFTRGGGGGGAGLDREIGGSRGGSLTGPGGAPSGGGLTAGGGGGGGSDQDRQIYDAIMRLLGRGEQPVTEQDVASQYLPVRNAMERQSQINRAQLAQRGAVQGTNIGGGGGATEGDINSLSENLGSAQGQLMSELIGEELSSRRQDVAQALQFAQGEQRLGLQRMMADIDAQLRSRGLDLQGRGLDIQQQLGNRGFDIQRELGNRGLGLQERQLGQQNQQFYDQFGYEAALQQYLLSQLYNQGLE